MIQGYLAHSFAERDAMRPIVGPALIYMADRCVDKH